MTIKLASLEIDTVAESEGEWIAIKEWIGLNPDQPFTSVSLPDVEFHVRSVNDQDFRNARQKAAEEIEKTRKDYPDGIIPDEVMAAADGKVIAAKLLLGWKGFDEEYTPELASKLLTKPQARIHRQMILWCAAKVGRREVEFVEDEAKN